MPLMYGDEYRCMACDQVPGYDRGEWSCACWAINDYLWSEGVEEVPNDWEDITGESEISQSRE